MELLLILLAASSSAAFHLSNSMVICEWTTDQISCPDRHIIQFHTASYGRNDNTTCTNNGYGGSSEVPDGGCESSAAIPVVRSTCDGQQSCQLSAVNSVYGDPCPGVHKYLIVNYACVRGNVRTCVSNHFHSFNGTVSCTNTNLLSSTCTFTCNDGYELSGEPVSQCETDGWSTPAPICIPCGFEGVSRDGMQTISSPGYPGNYRNWESCEWRIRSPSLHSFVHFKFDSFDTEGGYDHVEILDGTRRLGRVSGSFDLSHIYSAYDLRVRFTSDDSFVRTGFQASYWTAPPPACPKVDLIFLLDGSGSIESSNFQLIKDWVSDVMRLSNLERIANMVSVGVIQYSSNSTVEIPLARYDQWSVFNSAVNSIVQKNSGTDTEDGVRTAIGVFNNASRSQTTKLLVILTDGTSSSDLLPVAREAKRAGITVMSIGVGNADLKGLQILANGGFNKLVYELADHSFLDSIAHNVSNLFMPGTACPDERLRRILDNIDGRNKLQHCAAGLKDGTIPDSRITASTHAPWRVSHGPEAARLDVPVSEPVHVGAWVLPAHQHGWIQVDFGRPTNVTGVITQGRARAQGRLSDNARRYGWGWVSQWVTSFQIKHSDDQQTWTTINKIFSGNRDWNSHVTNMFPEVIRARYVRLYIRSCSPTSPWCALRMEYLTC